MSQNGDAPETASDSTHSRRKFLGASALGLAGLAAAGSTNAAAATTWEDHDHSGDFGGKTDLGASSPVSSITVDDVLTRGSPHKNVKAYGAVGDGATDDTAAIQAALDAANDGDVVFFPPGTYVVSSALTQTGTSLSLVGSGMGTSVLRFTHAGNGIDLDLDSPSAGEPDTVNVRDLTLVKTQTNAGTALDLTWANRSSSTWVHARVENMEIRGDDPDNNSHCWVHGVRLEDAWNAVLTNVHVQGAGDRYGNAVMLDGRCVDAVLSDVHAYYVDTGIEIANEAEGVHVRDGTFVAVNRGVAVRSGTDRPPLLYVQNCHANAYEVGVLVQDRSEAYVAGNLLYKAGGSADFAGVDVQNGRDVRVVGNCVIPLTTDGANNGIIVRGGTERAVVANNQFRTVDSGVWLTSASGYSIAALNTYAGSGSVVTDQGTANEVQINLEQ